MQKPYICPTCKSEFEALFAFTRHLREAHQKVTGCYHADDQADGFKERK